MPSTIKAHSLEATEHNRPVKTYKYDEDSLQRWLVHSLRPAVTADMRTTTADALRLSHRAFTFERAPRGPTPELRRSCRLHKSPLFSIIAYQHPTAIHTNTNPRLHHGSSTQGRARKSEVHKHRHTPKTPCPQNTKHGREQSHSGFQYAQFAFFKHR